MWTLKLEIDLVLKLQHNCIRCSVTNPCSWARLAKLCSAAVAACSSLRSGLVVLDSSDPASCSLMLAVLASILQTEHWLRLRRILAPVTETLSVLVTAVYCTPGVQYSEHCTVLYTWRSAWPRPGQWTRDNTRLRAWPGHSLLPISVLELTAAKQDIRQKILRSPAYFE